MKEFKEVELTKKQVADLKACIAMLEREDYSFELAIYSCSDFVLDIFARAVGYLSFSNVPFSAAYRVIREFAYSYWDNYKKR